MLVRKIWLQKKRLSLAASKSQSRQSYESMIYDMLLLTVGFLPMDACTRPACKRTKYSDFFNYIPLVHVM